MGAVKISVVDRIWPMAIISNVGTYAQIVSREGFYRLVGPGALLSMGSKLESYIFLFSRRLILVQDWNRW